MATRVPTEEPVIQHDPTANLETDLALEFLRVVEEAAVASAKTMGQGDRKNADQVATEAMRGVMDSVPMDGTIVIGEGNIPT
jgi:fructose-1,6-bisphosphatase II